MKTEQDETNVQGTTTKVVVLNNEKTINLSVTEMSENSNFLMRV